jgi:hypothetical protein
MKTKIYLIFIFFIIIILSGIILSIGNSGMISGSLINGYKTDKVIDNLHKAIKYAEEKGNYRCCIKPACTMCYLGNWKFEKGTCYCDNAIIESKEEDVCPECKKGIEEGFCSSDIEKGCELDEEIYGGKKSLDKDES